MVSELVLKTFGIKKVLESVSKKIVIKKSIEFGIGKKFRIRFRSDFGYCHTLESNDTLNKLWCNLWTVLYSSGTQVGKYKTKTMMVNQPTTTQNNQEFRNKAPLWKVKNIKNRFLQKKNLKPAVLSFHGRDYGDGKVHNLYIKTLKLE